MIVYLYVSLYVLCSFLYFPPTKHIFTTTQGKGTGSGHRTLLYGNAILLRHGNSDMVCSNSLLWRLFF